MSPLAGLVGEVVRYGQAASKERETIFLSGELGPNDVIGLLELHKEEDRCTNDKVKDKMMEDKENNEEGEQ